MPEKERMTDFRREDRRLIGALLLATAGWVAHLNVSYILVPESCSNGSKMMLHGLTVVCIAITIAGASIAWRLRRPDVVERDVRERIGWMAISIVVFAAALVVVIVAQEIPNVMLRSCD